MEFPLGVFSIALATVILPGLAAHHAADSPARFTATLDWALRLTIIVVLPATTALVVLAGPLTVTIFHYGRFDENDVRMSALALMAYASGLLGFSLVKVLAPGFFARQDTKTPVRIGIQSLGVNIGLNLAVVLPLALTHDRPGLHALLALNNGIGAWYNSSMLYRGLRRQGVLKHAPGWRRLLLQVAFATVLMCAFLWWLAGSTTRWIGLAHLAAHTVDDPAGRRRRGHLLWHALVAGPAARGPQDRAADGRGSCRYGKRRWNWFAAFITCDRVIAGASRRSATTMACIAATSTCWRRCGGALASSRCRPP